MPLGKYKMVLNLHVSQPSNTILYIGIETLMFIHESYYLMYQCAGMYNMEDLPNES